MRIGQLAAQTGFSVRTIRFYEQSGRTINPSAIHRTIDRSRSSLARNAAAAVARSAVTAASKLTTTG
jgi:MerR family regulatory protein